MENVKNENRTEEKLSLLNSALGAELKVEPSFEGNPYEEEWDFLTEVLQRQQ